MTDYSRKKITCEHCHNTTSVTNPTKVEYEYIESEMTSKNGPVVYRKHHGGNAVQMPELQRRFGIQADNVNHATSAIEQSRRATL